MKTQYLYKTLLKILVWYKLFAIVILFCIVTVVWRFVDTEVATEYYMNTSLDGEIQYLQDTKKPVIVFWTAENRKGSISEKCSSKCDVFFGKVMLPPNTKGAYFFYASNIDFTKLPIPRQPEKVIWALLHEESPRNVAELMHEKILNVFNYSSTFSRYSDVPFPLQSIVSLENVTSTEYFIETQQKNLLLKEIGPILFLQSDCDTATERDKYVEALQKYQRIDSYGSCLTNRELPSDVKSRKDDYLNALEDPKFLNFVARYKFVIAIENGVCEDYITEKLWRAIRLGVVPIYFGSPSIRDWLPNEKSAILLEDFPTPELLSQHIDELLSNDQLYEAYLEHKTKRKISNQKLIDELQTRPYQTKPAEIENTFLCFVCEKIHEKKKTVHIVTKRQYNCPKPISALTQQVEKTNDWVGSWEYTKRYVDSLYNKIMN